jgi:hypothetical protein
MLTELEHEQALAQLLRELPDGGARPYDWREFQRRARIAPARAARMASARALVATAVIAVAISATAIRLGPGSRPLHSHAAPLRQQPGRDGAAARSDDAYTESWLASLPHEPALVHVGTRAAVETLEDDIAQVDDLVSTARAGRAPAARLQVLLDERTELVNSLAQVRYAETLADASR